MRKTIMSPYEVYTTYLAMKKHFTDNRYDYFKYGGKTRTSEKAFNKRKDKYFFERMSRKFSDEDIKMYFIANFVATDTPEAIWVGEIMRAGEKNFQDLLKKHQSLTYHFTQQCSSLFEEYEPIEIFNCSSGHPPILKNYLGGQLSIETITIIDKALNFSEKLDKKLNDPVWETVSHKIKNYKPFLNIDIDKCKKILRDLVYVN